MGDDVAGHAVSGDAAGVDDGVLVQLDGFAVGRDTPFEDLVCFMSVKVRCNPSKAGEAYHGVVSVLLGVLGTLKRAAGAIQLDVVRSIFGAGCSRNVESLKALGPLLRRKGHDGRDHEGVCGQRKAGREAARTGYHDCRYVERKIIQEGTSS